MKDILNAQYLCRGKVNWKAGFIIIIFVSLIWALILFIPRPGNPEKDKYFYILLGIGIGLDLLILYVCSLRQWSKTWIKNGVIYSDIAFGLIPLSKKMPLDEVKEVCFVYNGVITRKKTDNPDSTQIKEMKDKIGKKIDASFLAQKPLSSTSIDDEIYNLPVYCGPLYLISNSSPVMQVRLDVVHNKANFKEVKEFLAFLPENVLYTWRFGQVGVHTIGSSY